MSTFCNTCGHKITVNVRVDERQVTSLANSFWVHDCKRHTHKDHMPAFAISEKQRDERFEEKDK